jgi:hypothetical protein
MNAGFVVGAAALLTLPLGDLLAEEIRGWLDLLPRAILRLAATRLEPARRQTAYENEWLPELLFVLGKSESLPIIRLLRGTWFALSLLTLTSKVRKPERRMQRLGQWLASASAWRITDFAVTLAGRKRRALHEEWHAHLIGEPDHELPAWQKARAALGFVGAAVRYRLQDVADLAWVPADAVLKSRMLSNLVVWFPTAAAAVILFHHGGMDEVLADAGSILAIGGALYGLIRIGRWWRGVKPQDPKVRGVND